MDQYAIPDQSEIEQAIGLKPGARRRKHGHRLLWALLLALAVALAAYLYMRNQQQAAATTYQTAEAARKTMTIVVSATGTIQPLTQIEIGSELSGIAREVLVAENAMVKAGTVLARLDSTRLAAQQAKAVAQLDAARARIATAEASMQQSSLTLNRQTKLRARSLSTDQEIEQADAELKRTTSALAIAKADAAAAEADLVLVTTDITKTEIVSPIEGIVLKRSVEPGQTVAASLQAPVLFKIAQDISRIQLEANVDEADVGVVKIDQSATFTVDAYPDRDFPARIERLSFAPETVDGVVTYKTILSADNADLTLRPGMTATAKIVVAQFKDALVVPNEALRYTPPRTTPSQGFSIMQIFMPRFPRNAPGRRTAENDGKRSLYVLENGALKEVKVKTGESDGKFTIVTEGSVKEGDSLVTSSRQGPAR